MALNSEEDACESLRIIAAALPVREAQREDAQEVMETMKQMDRLQMAAEDTSAGPSSRAAGADAVMEEVECETPLTRRRRRQSSGLDEVSDATI